MNSPNVVHIGFNWQSDEDWRPHCGADVQLRHHDLHGCSIGHTVYMGATHCAECGMKMCPECRVLAGFASRSELAYEVLA